MKASSRFSDEPAPCRRRRAGERYADEDDATVLTELVVFTCGCRIISNEYHDGSVNRTIVRHDGRTMLDELLAAH